MLCEKCQIRPAAVHMTKIINGAKTEMVLCEVCAKEENAMGFGIGPKWMLQNIFAELFNQSMSEKQSLNTAQPKHLQCDRCGFTDIQFSKVGKLGCPRCYEVFENKLGSVLKRIHGNPVHTGKIPKRTGSGLGLKRKIEELKSTLQEAIAREEYERAAQLRDEIRSLEGQV